MSHHELSPSAFPAWAECPCFDSDEEERTNTLEGTLQHDALSKALKEQPDAYQHLSATARENVQWAEQSIRTLAGEDPIQSEVKLRYMAPDAFARGGQSEVYYGTADVLIRRGNHADLIDYKSGTAERDHRAQLAGYALALFSQRARIKTVRCHVLYGASRSSDSWALSQADAAGIVLPILEARNRQDRLPKVNSYCTFCRHRLTCPALLAEVSKAAAPAEWEEPLPALQEVGATTDPETLGKALDLARLIEIWSKAVRKAATELAQAGSVPPGYQLQSRRGTREITDTQQAIERIGIPPDSFLGSQRISLSKLADTYATTKGVTKKQATEQLETLVCDLIEEKKGTVSLVAAKQA